MADFVKLIPNEQITSIEYVYMNEVSLWNWMEVVLADIDIHFHTRDLCCQILEDFGLYANIIK